MEAKVFKEHLENDLIPFWNKMKDETNGGFYGYADAEGNPDVKRVKGVILNSRILWFYSSAYQLLHKPELLEMADHAYRFLVDFCFDFQYGGVYWSVNYDGTVCDDTKHTYNCRLKEGYPGGEYVDVISTDIYLSEYSATDYREDHEKLIAETTKNKVAALAEVGYIPDIEILEKSHTPWAYYMTWSKEFCIGEQYNRMEKVQKMYSSNYAVTLN